MMHCWQGPWKQVIISSSLFVWVIWLKILEFMDFGENKKIVARGLEVILYWRSQSPSSPCCAVLPEVLEALDTMRPLGTSPFQTGTLQYNTFPRITDEFERLFFLLSSNFHQCGLLHMIGSEMKFFPKVKDSNMKSDPLLAVLISAIRSALEKDYCWTNVVKKKKNEYCRER